MAGVRGQQQTRSDPLGEAVSCEEQLKELGVFTPQSSRDRISPSKSPKGKNRRSLWGPRRQSQTHEGKLMGSEEELHDKAELAKDGWEGLP